MNTTSGISLTEVVPWGRSLAEYRKMFSLSSQDLTGRILGCADGPASFNRELHQMGGQIVSCDPIYSFTKEQLRHRIEEVHPLIRKELEAHREAYIWQEFRDAEELCSSRLRTMSSFLDDFEPGLSAGRYLPAELPSLPFADREFNLALVSHFLFLYSQQLSEEFHVTGILELCRVADEIRIYPLIDLMNQESQHLETVLKALDRYGSVDASLVPVPYKFQRGATQMLRIVARDRSV